MEEFYIGNIQKVSVASTKATIFVMNTTSTPVRGVRAKAKMDKVNNMCSGLAIQCIIRFENTFP